VGHHLGLAGAGGEPTEGIIMSNPHPKKHSGDIRVNLAGIDPDLATDEVTATLTLLSEGVAYCAACKEEIPGLAVYVTRPRPGHRDGYEVVAVMCPECAGYDGELA
jgi:hypothetical protein